jgi:hypothetical protein
MMPNVVTIANEYYFTTQPFFFFYNGAGDGIVKSNLYLRVF